MINTTSAAEITPSPRSCFRVAVARRVMTVAYAWAKALMPFGGWFDGETLTIHELNSATAAMNGMANSRTPGSRAATVTGIHTCWLRRSMVPSSSR